MKTKKIQDYKDFGETNDVLFEKLVDKISDIVTGADDHEIIYIREDDIAARGYSDLKSFKIEFMPRVIQEVSRRTNKCSELICDLVRLRIEYLPQSYSIHNIRGRKKP